jgi:hypothetical protein
MIQAAICWGFGRLLLSIVALADCSCKDSAISRKVKHKELDGGLHGPTHEIFSKCCFLGMLNCCKLHKNRPGSFFAHNHFKDLIKNCAISSKAFSDLPQADQAQYKHTHSLKF